MASGTIDLNIVGVCGPPKPPTPPPTGNIAHSPLHPLQWCDPKSGQHWCRPAVEKWRRFTVELNALEVIAGSNSAVVCRDVLYSIHMSAPDLWISADKNGQQWDDNKASMFTLMHVLKIVQQNRTHVYYNAMIATWTHASKLFSELQKHSHVFYVDKMNKTRRGKSVYAGLHVQFNTTKETCI